MPNHQIGKSIKNMGLPSFVSFAIELALDPLKRAGDPIHAVLVVLVLDLLFRLQDRHTALEVEPLCEYTFWALSASPLVKDVAILETATPGEVRIVVLSTEGTGAPDAALLVAVDEATQPRRPLTDHVMVEAATVQAFTIEAELTLYDGPDAEVVRQAALASAQAFLDEHHRLGHDITMAGLHAALYRPGVQDVTITAPAASLVIPSDTAAHCTAITVTVGGRDV